MSNTVTKYNFGFLFFTGKYKNTTPNSLLSLFNVDSSKKQNKNNKCTKNNRTTLGTQSKKLPQFSRIYRNFRGLSRK